MNTLLLMLNSHKIVKDSFHMFTNAYKLNFANTKE